MIGLFLFVDLSFFTANLTKIAHGGWFPLAVGLVIFLVLTTWKRGRALLWERVSKDALELETFLNAVSDRVPRVPGTAIFMTGTATGTPGSLLHNLKHNKVLHEQVVVLTVRFEEIPYVPEDQRFEVTTLPKNFYRVLLRYGFMEEPNIPDALRKAQQQGPALRPDAELVFPQPRDRDPQQQAGHGDVARAHLRLDVAQRHQRHGLLQHPAQPRGRAGHADRDLARRQAPALWRASLRNGRVNRHDHDRRVWRSLRASLSDRSLLAFSCRRSRRSMACATAGATADWLNRDSADCAIRSHATGSDSRAAQAATSERRCSSDQPLRA